MKQPRDEIATARMVSPIQPVEPSAVTVPLAVPLEHDGANVAGMQTYWSTPLCAFWHDCCLCWAVICCAELTTAQMCARTLKGHKMKGLIFTALLAVMLLGRIVPFVYVYGFTAGLEGEVGESSYESKYVGNSMYSSNDASANANMNELTRRYLCFLFFMIALGLVSQFTICVVRYKIRQRNKIVATFCPAPLDDFVFAWSYPCCSLMQMMRHEGLTEGRYNLCSIDGEQGCCV